MTQQARRDGAAGDGSLIEAAVAWVPPWERAAPEPAADPEPDSDPDHPVEPDSDPAGGPDPELDRPAEPDPELAGAGPGSDAEPVGIPAVAAPGATATGTAEPAADAGPPMPVAPAAQTAAGPSPAPEAALAAQTDPGPSAAAQAPAEVPDGDLRPALEAIMLVVDEPVGEALLADVLGRPAAEISAELDALAAEYTRQRRGFDLRRAAGGWRLYTRAEVAGYVERFVLDGQSVRLTQAALETLAVVAYKQPVTRARISAVRGVNCDGVVRTLVTRGLIEECGAEPETGAHLYRTTSLFLEKLGLDTLDELPALAPFLPDNVDEVDAER